MRLKYSMYLEIRKILFTICILIPRKCSLNFKICSLYRTSFMSNKMKNWSRISQILSILTLFHRDISSKYLVIGLDIFFSWKKDILYPKLCLSLLFELW